MNINVAFRSTKMNRAQAEFFNNKLLMKNSVDIICHPETDNDAFGAARTMAMYLNENDIKTRIIADPDVNIYEYNNTNFPVEAFDNVNKYTSPNDTALILDFHSRPRLKENMMDFIYSHGEKNIFTIDHHNFSEPIIEDVFVVSSDGKEIISGAAKQTYVDMSAKSCCAIIYRLFESLGLKLNKIQLKYLFAGMVSDMYKSGLINFNEDKILLVNNIDENSKEVFDKVEKQLADEDKKYISKNVNILNNLTNNEKIFQKELFSGIKFNQKGNLAYVELLPDDYYWLKIGNDNNRTVTLLKDFRVRLLSNANDDELIPEEMKEKLSNIEFAAVFYPNLKNNKYKISCHSKSYDLREFLNYVKTQIDPNIITGGHKNRCGGHMTLSTAEECHKWTQKFIQAFNKI